MSPTARRRAWSGAQGSGRARRRRKPRPRDRRRATRPAVHRRGAARRRVLLSEIEWSVLISFLRGDARRCLPADAEDLRQGRRNAHRRGDRRLGALARLAARIPIVLVAGIRWGRTPTSSAPITARHESAVATGRAARQDKAIRRRGPGQKPGCAGTAQRLRGGSGRAPRRGLAGIFQGRSPLSAASGRAPNATRPRRELPDAIVCANDQIAIGAIRELQAAGMRVPADIGVVGFDDMHASALFAPPLTTVRSRCDCSASAPLAPAEADADPSLPPRTERLPAKLIIRESCGCSGHTARGAESGR